MGEEKKKEREKEKEIREERKIREKLQLFSTIYGDRWVDFIGPRTKDHLLDKGYVWVSKTRDFVEGSSEEFWKSRVSGLGSVHWTS